MKSFAAILALALIATACGSSDSDSSATSATSPTATTGTTLAPGGGDGTTSTAPATATSGAGDTTTTTTQTTTTIQTTTGGGSATEAFFVISRVVFGDEGYVAITNVGGESGNLEGWQLCQKPAYYRIGSVEVAPGETVRVTVGTVQGLSGQVVDAGGRFGSLSASSGEVGLYVDNAFGSASSIRSYLEWGSSPHGRSSVAVEAGVWQDGGFVQGEGASGIAATVDVPTSPADWTNS